MINNIEMFEFAKNTYGGVNMSEMVGLFDTIIKHLKCPEGMAADLGSHEGKSSIIGAAALSYLNRADDFHLVELIEFGKPNVKERVTERVTKYSSVPVTLVEGLSVDFIYENGGPFSYVFVDTDHDISFVMPEGKGLEDRMLPGGLIFFHDFKNQYPAPAQVYQCLIDTGKYEEVEIDWDSAIQFTKEHGLKENDVTFARYDGLHATSLSELTSFEYPVFIGCLRRI